MQKTLLLILSSVFLFACLPMYSKETEEIFSDSSTEVIEPKVEETEMETDSDVNTTEKIEAEDNTDSKKHYLAALGTIIAPSAVIGSYNRFVSRASWAKVNFDDVTHFYEHEWKWDEDWYWTNFVLHPYQGSLSYMGARALNLNIAESALICTASSATWEYFFERNSPSKNDLIYTSIGGVVVGEMFYRLSLEANDWSKLVSYALNPTRLYSEWFEKYPANTPKNLEELSLRFTMGAGKAYSKYGSDGSMSEVFPIYLGPEFALVYADPFGHDTNTPYSQFELSFGGEAGKGSNEGANDMEKAVMYRIQVQSNGVLWSRAPDFSHRDTTIGFVMDYDFMWHSFMEFSSLSPAFAIKQRINYDSSHIDWQAHLGWNLLGTSDNFYFRRGFIEDISSYRDYSYCTGPEIVLKWKWASDKGHVLDFDAHLYGFYDFDNQLQDIDSIAYKASEIINLRYEHPVSDTVRLGLDNEIYMKQAFYEKTYPDVFQIMYSPRIYARIMLIQR